MKKLRWAMDGEFWDVDLSTPLTVDGLARSVPGDALPLGLSRGTKLSRHRQVDFFQRFMAAPFVPSYAGDHGFFIQRVLSIPLPTPIGERWFGALLSQFNVEKFFKSMKKKENMQHSDSSMFQNIKTHISDISLYTLNFCSELLLTANDTLLFSLEKDGDNNNVRKKAILHHKFPHHNLTIEAAGPSLFVDEQGNYWDVPFSMAADLASLASDSSKSYHFSINHVSGSPYQVIGDSKNEPPPALLSELRAKFAASCRNHIDIWRSETPKLTMVQPYDIFMSTPHVSLSWILGGVVTASFGNDLSKGLAANADLFTSMSFSAQHGNFQRRVLDLTRFQMRMDFASVSKLVTDITGLGYDLYNSRVPLSLSAVEAICPNTIVSIQQQIAGPFSVRVDSGIKLCLEKKDWKPTIIDPVFAVEYALQVLGSAKAVAWFSPKQREFMVELRFFET